MKSHLSIWYSAVALVLSVSSVSAHAMLVHANPPAGAVIAGSPPQVTLEFSEELEPSFSTVSVVDVAGKSVSSGATQFAGARRRKIGKA